MEIIAGNKGVSIIIPTFNGGRIFQQCMEKLRLQTYPEAVQIIVIDSGSSDGTVEMSKAMGAQVIEIPQAEFHHAQTRNRAVQFAQHEYCILMVQDAIPTSEYLLRTMTESLDSTDCLAAYGPPVPHADADCFSRFETLSHSEYLGRIAQIQQLPDGQQSGGISYNSALRIARLDNVCAIYRTQALRQMPFPKVAYGEDMAWAWAIMHRKGKIFYNPQINVFHSHNRPAEYRFKRSIVDSLNCALILKRVREMPDKLDTDDLLVLEEVMGEVRKEFHAAAEGGSARESNTFEKLQRLGRWPLMKNIFRQFTGRVSHPSAGLLRETYKRSFSEHMTHIINSVKLYPAFDLAAYHETVEQGAALRLGFEWGESYAGHMLSGTLEKSMEQLVKPYCEGV